jgi:MSHA biogenesis protein MshG
MPQFTWTGRDARQIVRSGVIEAPSAAQAADALAAMSMVPDAILPLPPAGAGDAALSAQGGPAPIALNDLLEFARQMHTLLRNGVTKGRAFTGLSASTANHSLADILHQIGTEVQGGQALWSAMAAHPTLFDAFVIAAVRRGEENQHLAESFKVVYLHLEFHQVMADPARDTRHRPALAVAAIAGAGIVALLGLVPTARSFYPESIQELPVVTSGLLATSDALSKHLLVLVLLTASFTAGLMALKGRGGKGSAAARWMDRLRLKEPLAGPTLRLTAVARMAGCLALGQRLALPIGTNLELAGRLCGNAHLRAVLDDVRRRFEQGDSLGDALGLSHVLPADAQQVLWDGEAQEAVPAALVEVTRLCRQEAEQARDRMEVRFRLAVGGGIGAVLVPVTVALALPWLS